MNKNKTATKMVASKSRNKSIISCSTPEHRADSPSRDSDSLCDSEAASPVPFLCTQDGVEGDTDVVWNYYTPKSDQTGQSRSKNSTPLSRKPRKLIRPKIIEKQIPKRRALKLPNKKTELFQELLELNKKLPELLAKKHEHSGNDNGQSGSEEDIFNDSPDFSPKSGLRNSSYCLRKNVLSSKFSKPEAETALESDDSMNECLLKASQMVEDEFSSKPILSDRVGLRSTRKDLKRNCEFKLDHDSMESILNNISFKSPVISKAKKFDSPKLCNDSFDSFVGNLNDSALEQLTQMPIKTNISMKTAKLKPTNQPSDSSGWMLKELVVHDSSPSSKTLFGRHSSMPESPTVNDSNKPSTSGMVFGRYNSMPFNKADNDTGDSPIRCTPDEIKRKHQQAREKLLAKRQLPFTSSQRSVQSLPDPLTQQIKNAKFQPRFPSSATTKPNVIIMNSNSPQKTNSNNTDIKLLIEKKRQEALMKLRRRQPK